MKYKSAKTYGKELSNLNTKLNTLNKEIRDKLLILATNHPDAIVGRVNDEYGGSVIKAKNTITPSHISNISIDKCLNYLIEIETWLEQQSNHQQLEIKYPE